ncbi:hypothetical protein BKA58DRAFT_393350 [Alternaria rosae]|uniref:uncharacterized protein n=1 Tax=Alternaria rosae TaxID=1187941 RepID=UPI001E8DA285|nr:uncharacterized protein BKA58DRAFT_393350 [Alternaria rosae]KAH6858979.1 hypothetical protein BKA58DRAFT_393350 [Alternaria rosae]
MKLFAPIILALAAASEAAFCNGGWGLPGGSTCPGAYPNSFCCQSPGAPSRNFPTFRNCVYPGSGGRPSLNGCGAGGTISCCG